MLGIYSAQQMRELDADLASNGNLEQVIDRAGFAIAVLGAKILGSCYARSVTIVVGNGNNGRDGLSAARWLRAWGAKVRVLPYEDAKNNEFVEDDLLIDAVLGFGYKEPYQGIRFRGRAKVLAVDIPSGLSADTGRASENITNADFTLTLAGAKLGLFIADGVGVCGETYLYDLGLTSEMKTDTFLVTPSDLRLGVDKTYESHKWKAGLAVFAGSSNMGGAAKLVTAAAMRSGAGIVHLFTDGESTPIMVGSTDPEIVFAPSFNEDDASNIWEERLSRFNAAVVGPGLGSSASVVLRGVIESFHGPIVIDADAITALSEDTTLMELLLHRGSRTVLTPHAGELSRLAAAFEFETSHMGLLRFAERYGLTLLVKGFPTRLYTPDARSYFLPVNPHKLATAGTGDVLAGIIGAAIARWGLSTNVISYAITVHGLAAAYMPTLGSVSYDLIEQIPKARKLVEAWPSNSPANPFWPLQSRGPLLFESDALIDWSNAWEPN